MKLYSVSGTIEVADDVEIEDVIAVMLNALSPKFDNLQVDFDQVDLIDEYEE